ncbi:MAG: dihydropteroate synthase [Aquimonas sp.]|nr:dihydropteroate synthase [Aquimonas sp.]
MFDSTDLIPRLDCGGRLLLLDRPRVMGVLNLTPDSFSDGGRFNRPDDALRAALRMVEEGADIIDVGGESTRPDALPVTAAEESDRVLALIERLSAESPVPVSIDTSSPEVMRAAVAAGAGMINDVRALRREGALETAAALAVPVCLMHMRGEPADMQRDPHYDDVVGEVQRFLADRVLACEFAGIPRSRLLVDPGFGFGKTLQHNQALMAALAQLVASLPPLLVGLSRKSMIGAITGRSLEQRTVGSAVAAVLAVQRGARLLRVHDVAETCDALAVLQALPERTSDALPRSQPRSWDLDD